MKKSVLTLAFILTMTFSAGIVRASVIYTPMNLTASQTSAWNWFAFPPDADGFGLWVNVGASLRLETYHAKVLGTDDGGKVYLNAIDYETEIGPAGNWLDPASPSYINDATHTALNGKTVYVAVQLTDADAKIYYAWLQLEVSADGLTVTLKGMAYQSEAGATLKAGVIDRQLFYESNAFMEDLETNDGTIGTLMPIHTEGVDFSIADGAFIQGTHYTVSGLPAGLEMEIRATDSRHGVIVLNGKASAHAVSDTVTNMSIAFADAAFTGASVSGIIDAVRDDVVIKFFDPYQIVYEDLADLICATGGWAPFSNAYFANEFGLWHDGTDQRIETYGRSIVGTSAAGRSYFTPIDEGDLISSSSTWVTTGAWPDEPYLNTSLYTTWNGKHKYAGIQLVVGNAVLYGWLNLEVAADGKTVTLYDWAFNTQPGAPIKAGQMVSGVHANVFGDNKVALFPNPVRSELTVTLTDPLRVPANLDIVDVSGKVVHREILMPDGSMRYQVDASKFSKGIYFVRMTSGDISFTGKMVRE
jgi:hypothetical protein